MLCGSSVYFGYTLAFWSTSSIFRRADIRQLPILRHRLSERSLAGSSEPSSCVACGRAHIRTASDLMAAMVPSVKIDRGHVKVEPDRGACLDILVTRLKCCFAAFCMVALLPLSAIAQIRESLTANALPPSAPPALISILAPIPLRLGNFFWIPRAELDESYNSNIFATTTSTTHDFITALAPGFDLVSNFPRNALNLHGSAVLQAYADHPAQNTQSGTISVDGKLDVSAGSSLYGTASVDHPYIAYGSPNSPGSPGSPANIAQPVTYWNYIATAGYQQGGRRFSYQVDVGVSASQYNAAQLVGGGVLPQSSQDATVPSAAVRAGYEIIPDYLGYIRVVGSRYDYTHIAPPATSANFSTYRADLGLQILPRHLISGEAYAGYLVQSSAQSGLGSTSTPDFGGNLTWSITRLTTLTFTGLMTFNTGTPSSGGVVVPGPAGNSYLSRTFTVKADHELLRDLLLNVNATYGNDSFQGITRTDNFFTGGAGVRYFVNQNLFLGGLFTYERYISTASGSSFTQNILTLRVGTQF